MEQDYRPIHNTMKNLCKELIDEKWIKSRKVYDAMMSVDRADFAPINPYENYPQWIGYNVVISAPLLHSYSLEILKDYLIEGNNALDIGFGSAYLTVAMSKMMNDKGCVVGIEHIKDLYDFGMNNITKHHKNLIENKCIKLILGEGREGYKAKAPYKCIHVGVSSLKIPKEFIEQLDFGGRLMMPLGPEEDQYIYIVDKDLEGILHIVKVFQYVIVP